MNVANLHHGHYAAVMFAAVFVCTAGNAAAAALAPIAFFISREHAQRSVQIARDRNVHVTDLKWWEGFTGWREDRWLDAGLPAVACAGLWSVVQVFT